MKILVITFFLLVSALSAGVSKNFGHNQSATGRGEIRSTTPVFMTTRDGQKVFLYTAVNVWLLSTGDIVAKLNKKLTPLQSQKIKGKYKKITIRSGEIIGAKR